MIIRSCARKKEELDQKYSKDKEKLDATRETKNAQSLDRMTRDFNTQLLRYGQAQQTMGQMWANTWNGMVGTFEANMLKMAEQWIMQAVFQKAMAKNEVLVHAKAGAAAAWHAMSGIPIVGPVLGGIAAGVTFAGIMALGSFKQGGVLPGDMMMYGHAEEMVLPRDLSVGLQNMIRGGGGPGDSGRVVINAPMTYAPTNIGDKAFLQQAMQSHPSLMSNEVKRGIRKGSIKFFSNTIPGYHL